MLFSELDAGEWLFLISALLTTAVAAIVSLVAQVLTLVLGYQREKAKIARESVIADKVEVVASTLVKADEASRTHLDRQDQKLAVIANQTNGMVDKVAESSKVAGVAIGKAESAHEVASQALEIVKLKEQIKDQ